MIVLIIYILFVVINIIICSIITYLDYNDGVEITLGMISMALLLIFLSIVGTLSSMESLLTYTPNRFGGFSINNFILNKLNKII